MECHEVSSEPHRIARESDRSNRSIHSEITRYSPPENAAHQESWDEDSGRDGQPVGPAVENEIDDKKRQQRPRRPSTFGHVEERLHGLLRCLEPQLADGRITPVLAMELKEKRVS